MPRSNRPRRRGPTRASMPAPVERRDTGTQGSAPTVHFAGAWWHYRDVRGNDSGRQFLCPGCQQQVAAATPHTVVWPSQSMQGAANRRHWHTRCWAARDRRPPGGSFA
ncbi:MAG: hypothetical protein WBG36_16155 [Ornithinimicrobium sp.]